MCFKHEDGIVKNIFGVKLKGKCLRASLRLKGEQEVRKYCHRKGRIWEETEEEDWEERMRWRFRNSEVDGKA